MQRWAGDADETHGRQDAIDDEWTGQRVVGRRAISQEGPCGGKRLGLCKPGGCAQIASDTWQLTDVERSGRVTLAVSQEVLRHDHALYRHVFHARECRAFSDCKTVLAIEGLRIHRRTQMKIPQATVTRYLLSCLQ